MILQTMAVLVLVFHGGNVNNVDYSDVGDTSKIPAKDKWFPVPPDFTRRAQDYTFDAQGLKLKPSPVVPAAPDIEGFYDDIVSDNSINIQIYQWMPFISKFVHKPARLKVIWAKVTANPPAWLTQRQINAIEGYAAARNMPLK